MSKYVVYPSDLKYKSLRNIDPKRAIWYNDNVKKSYHSDSHDTLEYRFDEYKKNNFDYLDLAYLELTNLSIRFPINFMLMKHLFLNNNQIQKIGNELKVLKNLEVLDISSNILEELTYLPPNLIELSCFENKLTKLPQHNKLQRLDISNNNMKEIQGYPELINLNCSDNKLQLLDVTKNLTYLDCSNNKKLSGKLSGMSKLKLLVCNNTKINEISGLDSLENLEIINCEIKRLGFFKTLCDVIVNEEQNISMSSKYKVLEYIREKNNIYLKFQ